MNRQGAQMIFEIEADISSVMSHMHKNIPAAKLVEVAAGIAALAPLVWGHHVTEPVSVIKISGDDLRIQPASNVSDPAMGCVVDGSEKATGESQ